MRRKRLGLAAMGVAVLAAYLALLAAPALAIDARAAVEKVVDDYTVSLAFDMDPMTGSNAVTVHVKDPMGADLSGAKVSVTPEAAAVPQTGSDKDSMGSEEPAPSDSEMGSEQPGMPSEMGEAVELEAGEEAGSYAGEIEFPDPGKWLVKVSFESGGQTREVSFDVDVAKKQPNWAVLGGFLFINLAVITGAGITKRKNAKA